MTVLGKYEVLEEIGRGGFSAVYKARDPDLDRIVALKILAPHLWWEPSFVEQFHREARTVARLRHPHIVIIYEIGEEEGQLYIAMEYLRGCTLARMLFEEGVLPLEQTVAILEQVADALDYAHGEGILHRDIKPSNIMVEEGGRVKLHTTLMDFGLVKAMEGSRYVRTSGRIVGTPEYMSPEQAEGEELDHRSDLYSLGVVAYQMCTGQAPFTAPSPLAVLRGHTDKKPPPPRELNPSLLVEVEQVLSRSLAKKREDRYQSAKEMAQALREAAGAEERARQREEYLSDLHGQLQKAVDDQDWAKAEAQYQEIQALEPAYRDVPELWARVREARAQQELEELYHEAKSKVENEAWAEAKDLCAKIKALEPGYRDVDELLRRVKEGLRQEQTQKERQTRLTRLEAEKAEAERVLAEKVEAEPLVVEESAVSVSAAPPRLVPSALPESVLPPLGWVKSIAVLAPGVILFALLRWLPMLGTVFFSFQYRSPVRQSGSFVGLENYAGLVSDPRSGPALRNTIGLVLIRLLVVGIVWWMLRAAWLKQRRAPTWLVLAAVAPLPFVSQVGNAVCWLFLGNPNFGSVGRILSWFAVPDAWLLLLIVDGLYTLAVSSAGGLIAYALAQRRRKAAPHPSLAALNAIRNVMLIVAAAGALQSFAWSYVITDGGPGYSTMTPLLAMYQAQYKFLRHGYGSAYATILLVALIILAVILWNTMKATSLRLVSLSLTEKAMDSDDRGAPSVGLRVLGLLPGVVILLPYIWILWLALPRPQEIPLFWGHWLVNSLVPGLAVWIVQLPVALLTAYAISLGRLPGKATSQVLLLLFVVAAIIGTGVVSAPLYSAVATLRWIDTVWTAALPLFSNGAAVILFVLFLKSMASRLVQARARGDSEASVLRRDILPAVRPLVLLVGVATTYWAGQRLFWPLLVLKSEDSLTASLAVLPWVRSTARYSAASVPAILISVLPLAIPCAVALVFLVRIVLRQMALVAGRE